MLYQTQGVAFANNQSFLLSRLYPVYNTGASGYLIVISKTIKFLSAQNQHALATAWRGFSNNSGRFKKW